MRVIAYDRKGGEKYHADDAIISDGFVKLVNPTQYQRVWRNIPVFDESTTKPRSKEDSLIIECGSQRYDLMLPSYAVIMEILNPDDDIAWLKISKKEAEAAADEKLREAQEKHDNAKGKYLNSLTLLERIIYHITG